MVLGAYVVAFVIVTLCVWIFLLLKKNAELKIQLENELRFSKSQDFLEQQMRENFTSISNEVLFRNHQNFLNIAKSTFDKMIELERSEYSKKQSDFLGIIDPIKEALTLVDSKITTIEKDRIESFSDLRRQVKDLMSYQQEIQKETGLLRRALSTPFMSGKWGEMQLRRVVEITGMLPYCDFVEQEQGDSSRLRPDMIIKLPGDRHIIVDSKAPIDAYINAVNNNDDPDQLIAHAKRIKEHIRRLGQKNYWEQFEKSPDFVIMFLPGESFFSSAIKSDPTLIEFGVSEKVIIATPITLIALLKAISYSWRQEAINKNAKQIGEAGKILYDVLSKLLDYTEQFEKKLLKSVDDYGKISSYLKKTVHPAASKLKNLGIEVLETEENKNDILSES